MSTVLEPQTGATTAVTNSQQLRATMGAVRLSLHWLGISKTLNSEQQEQAAETFGANGDYLSARKKLIDTRHPVYRSVTAIRSQMINLWKGMTLPFPEAGIRLIRQTDIEVFESQFQRLQAELQEAVEKFDLQFHELKQTAQERLGRLYNESDYPESLLGLFRAEVDYPNVEPPTYLRNLDPELYAAEARRISARFDEALELAEEAFMAEFNKLVVHLTSKLTGESDGKPKVFRDTAVTNLTEFFERFRRLNVNSNAQLEELVEHAQQVVQGVAPQALRNQGALRQSVSQELTKVQTKLEDMLEDRPRRRILRNSPQLGAESCS